MGFVRSFCFNLNFLLKVVIYKLNYMIKDSYFHKIEMASFKILYTLFVILPGISTSY